MMKYKWIPVTEAEFLKAIDRPDLWCAGGGYSHQYYIRGTEPRQFVAAKTGVEGKDMYGYKKPRPDFYLMEPIKEEIAEQV